MQEKLNEVIQFLELQGMKQKEDAPIPCAGLYYSRPLKYGSRKTNSGDLFELQTTVSVLEDGEIEVTMFVGGEPKNRADRRIYVSLSFYNMADLKKEFRMTEDRLSFCVGELS